jgi:hypothetical protein
VIVECDGEESMQMKKSILWKKNIGRLICTASAEAVERSRGKEDTCRKL